MTAQEISSQPEFRGPAKANNVPVARLIGFEVKSWAGHGHLVSRTSACKSHGDAARRNSMR
jgi:hypothetical protein